MFLNEINSGFYQDNFEESFIVTRGLSGRKLVKEMSNITKREYIF